MGDRTCQGGRVINDIIRGVSLAMAGGIGVTAAIVIIRWCSDNRKPGCHCWACRRMNKNPRDPQLAAELRHHFFHWEHDPTVTPDRGRS